MLKTEATEEKSALYRLTLVLNNSTGLSLTLPRQNRILPAAVPWNSRESLLILLSSFAHLVTLLRLRGEQPSRQCKRLRRSSRPPPAALTGLSLVSCWRLLIKIQLGRNPLVPCRLKKERLT